MLCVAAAVVTPAQWLDHKTPRMPRTADGKPNLIAPAPRTSDGKPDLAGLWLGVPTGPDSRDLQPWAREVTQRHADDFFKTSPAHQCLPSGPNTFGQTTDASVWKRILQTSSLIAILNDDLTYRQIFIDGRALEAAPSPTWMGYSVGHWEDRTLVVDSFGFNDRTWLSNRGLPHTEALRMTERYQRRDFGHLRIDVTFTDPVAYTTPLSFVVNMELAADTEMIEAVCETGSEHWVGRLSDGRTSAVSVAPEVLAKYVGVYSGFWAGRPRKVEVALAGGELVARINDAPQRVPLVAQSDTLFESTGGLSYRFIIEDSGPATHVVEIHVSGDYKFARLH
jgi:hypothetical protein